MNQEITLESFSPLDFFGWLFCFYLSSGQKALPFLATFTGLKNANLGSSAIILFCY